MKDNTWFITYTGKQFFPLAPRVEDICIEDIAHSLSQQCRYAGHTREFYSVAEHSCLVAELVPGEFALEGLLHDAAEAYCQDLIRPIKHAQGFEVYREVEERLQRAVARRFGLVYPYPEIVDLVDKALVLKERDALINFEGMRASEWEDPGYTLSHEVIITCRVPQEAERDFLELYRELRVP